jgi:hypothetical protein
MLRPSWVRLTRGGIPPLFVVRPKPPFTGAFGEEFPAPDPVHKVDVMRVRQLYQQKHIGVAAELDRLIRKNPTLMDTTGEEDGQND